MDAMAAAVAAAAAIAAFIRFSKIFSRFMNLAASSFSSSLYGGGGFLLYDYISVLPLSSFGRTTLETSTYLRTHIGLQKLEKNQFLRRRSTEELVQEVQPKVAALVQSPLYRLLDIEGMSTNISTKLTDLNSI